ncbi:coiled-coil domain-containing protein 94 like protein [Quercus suber]|uniref:Coiled-coil domain-containing protein 94 like protein n=1 Tax=Quercus suber TaxID=58331 RepID=A0AAW0M3G4_QUESU
MGEIYIHRRFIPPIDDPIFSTSRSAAQFGTPYKKLPFPMPMKIPLSICCDTCSYFIRRGKTILSRKEQVIGEDFMGIPIYRFRFNCTKCSAPLSIKADHVNLDRVVESGATRMTEEEERQVAVRVRKAAEEEVVVGDGDAMKSSENKREIAALDDDEEVAVKKGRIGEAAEEVGLALNSVENRTFDSQREIAALDGVKSIEVV